MKREYLYVVEPNVRTDLHKFVVRVPSEFCFCDDNDATIKAFLLRLTQSVIVCYSMSAKGRH